MTTVEKKRQKRQNGDGCFRIRQNGLIEYIVTVKVDIGLSRPKSFYGKTKSECRQKYIKSLQNCVEIKKGMLVGEWMEKYLPIYKADIKETGTYEHYETLIKKHIKPSFLGSMPLDAVEEIHAFQFMKTQQDLSKSHQTKVKALLKGAFKKAVKNRLCRLNPFDDIHVKNQMKKASYENTFTREECIIIRDYCLANPCMLSRACYILLYTGMRLGELCGLMPSDFDYEVKMITINRVVYRKKGGKKGIKSTAKTDAGLRAFYLLPQLENFLLSLTVDSLYIIHTRAGEYYNSRSFDRMLIEYIAKIPGVRNLGTHAFRHALVTDLARQGVNTDDIALVVGHDDSKTTEQVYYLKDKQRIVSAMQKLTY